MLGLHTMRSIDKNPDLLTSVPMGTGGEGVLRGMLSETCTSGRWVEDFEGIQRWVQPNCPARKGSRIVTNLLKNSVFAGCSVGTVTLGNQPTNWGIAKNLSHPWLTSTIVDVSPSSITIRMAGVNSGTESWPDWLTSNSGGIYLPVKKDDYILTSVTARVVAGVFPSNGVIFTHQYLDASGSWLTNAGIPIIITSTPTRFEYLAKPTNSRTAQFYTNIYTRGDTNAFDCTIEFSNIQLEIVTGQSVQTPGEYIPTTSTPVTKCFDTKLDGTPLRPFYFPQGAKKYKVYEESPRSTTFVTGEKVEGVDQNGIRRYYTNIATVSGAELVTNGTFDTDTVWTKGTGWTISGGVATCSGTSININQVIASMAIGKTYEVTYTVLNYVSGSISFDFGAAGEKSISRNTNGTFTQAVLKRGNGFYIYFYGGAFAGSIDNVSVKEVMQTSATAPTAFPDGTTKYLSKELVDNGGFDNWSGVLPSELPFGWVISANDANNYVTNNGGKCRVVSNNTNGVSITQTILTAGKTYEVSLNATVVSGAVKLTKSGGVIVQNINASGTYTYSYVADQAQFTIQRNGSCDISIDNVSVREVTPTASTTDLVDGTVTWRYSGLATYLGLVCEPASTNKCTNYNVIPVDVLGSEVNALGNFTGWVTQHASATITAGTLTITNGVNTVPVYKSTLVLGKIFSVTYTISSISGGTVAFAAGQSGITGVARATAGTFTEVLPVCTGNTAIEIRTTSSVSTVLTAISIKEVQWAVGTKSFGTRTLGAELITNAADRGFSSDTGWWQKVVNAGSSITISGGSCVIDTNGVYTLLMSQSIMTIGKVYELTYDLVRNSGTETLTSLDSGGGTLTFGAAQKQVFISTNVALGIKRGTGVSGNFTLDNISLKEVTITYTQNIPGMTLSGGNPADATYPTLEIIDDTAAHQEAGIYGLTGGKGYRGKSNGNSGNAYVVFNGTVGNLNSHSFSVYARSTSTKTLTLYLSATGGTSANIATYYTYAKISNKNATYTWESLALVIYAGQTMDFILNQLEEQTAATSPMIVQGATTTRATTLHSLKSGGNMTANNFAISADIMPTNPTNSAKLIVQNSGSPGSLFYIHSGANGIATFDGANLTVSAATTSINKLNRCAIMKSTEQIASVLNGILAKNTITVPLTLSPVQTIGSNNGGTSSLHGSLLNLRVLKNAAIEDAKLITSTTYDK